MFEEKVILGTLEGVFKLNSQSLPNGSYVIKLLNGDEEHSEVVNIFH